MKEEISNWWKGAREDLRTAEYNLRGDMLHAAAFYSQQAAEKGLKALQIKKLEKFEKTHDLVLIAKSVGAPAEIAQICEDLAPFYTITRYPDVKIRVDKKIASSVVEKSRKVLEWVDSSLK